MSSTSTVELNLQSGTKKTPNVTPHPESTDLEVTSIRGKPFPDSIKEAAELRETGEQKNGGAESLTTSTMTTTVSESSPAFWRGQPLKI